MNPDLWQRLAETVAWCSYHAWAEEAGRTTRSVALRPTVIAMPRKRGRFALLAGQSAREAVAQVCEARCRELASLGIAVPPVGPDLAGGRILRTTIDTDSCWAATEISNGYYDLDDLPGWDTWFHHAATDRPWGAIYCWVPASLIELAEAGMEMMPFQCVEWADLPEA
jgi:hypothetical protein